MEKIRGGMTMDKKVFELLQYLKVLRDLNEGTFQCTKEIGEVIEKLHKELEIN